MVLWQACAVFSEFISPVVHIVSDNQSAFVLLIFCTVFGYLVLPKIDRQQSADTSKSRQSVIAPLKLFLPLRREGKRDFTLFLLATGTFFSVLATGYVPMALQLVGQNVFGFRPAQNGFMLVSRF